jgi:hypothetical protein
VKNSALLEQTRYKYTVFTALHTYDILTQSLSREKAPEPLKVDANNMRHAYSSEVQTSPNLISKHPHSMEHLRCINGWLLETPPSKRDSHYSWPCLRWRIIFSLVFQHVRICTTTTPIEARNRILKRLRKGYYPLRQDSAWLCLGIRALILARYFWLAAKMLFLELYLLNFLFWRLHGYARRRNIQPQLTRIFSPGFHRLAVLAPSSRSRIRYTVANVIATAYHLWASLFPFPLIIWAAFVAANSFMGCHEMKATAV